MVTQTKIIDGPSKFDLMLALFDRKGNDRTVDFKTEDGKEWSALIRSVEVEDGSGESWNVSAMFDYKRRPGVRPSVGAYVKFYFNTANRQGILLGQLS